MSDIHLATLLQQAEWHSSFDERTLGRARTYALDGSVSGLRSQPTPDGYALDAEIAGSHGERYDCHIEITLHGKWLTMDTACTCPVGVDCKHAAAMLIATASTARLSHARARTHTVTDPSSLLAWEQWLRTLDMPSDAYPYTADAERRFGVLLRATGSEPGSGLMACPAWLRPSKNRSGLVDPQPLQLHERHGAMPMPANGWPVGIAAALVCLLHAPSRHIGNQRYALICAVHEEQALEQLLAQYPVWFERASMPLQRGDTLPLTLRWLEADDGSQRLVAHVAANDTQLLRGASLWYVQPKQGRYGRIDGDPRVFGQLRHAPILQPAQVGALRQHLRQGNASHRLPEPVDHGPAELVAATPQPILQLRAVKLADWRGRHSEIGLARLGFDYAGHLLPPSATAQTVERRLCDGRLYEVRRDQAIERQASSSLERLGIQYAVPLLYDHNTIQTSLDNHDLLLRPDLRQPPLPPLAWRDALDALAAAGFRLDYDASFPHDEQVTIDDWHAELTPSGNAWFDVALGVEIAGERIDLLPVLRQLLADPAFPRVAAKREKKNASWRVKLDDTRSVEMPLARLRTLIEPLLEWLEGESGGTPRVHRSQLAELDTMALPWRGGEELRAQIEQLRSRHHQTKPPRGLKATLRPYQRDGLTWLDFLGAAGLGGILADDMGLGKTVQVLAHLLSEKQRGRLTEPVLVVAPTSLVGNWQAEAARFAPSLKVLVIHGADRSDRYDEIAAHDLIITTYPLLPRDRDKLVAARFALLVLDEAQAIKNAASHTARVVREIPAARRLAMTGTPLENHLGELWAQFDAVEPGLLGNQRQFTRFYRTPIEKHRDAARQQRLNRRIGPLLLRRRKDEVLADLPRKSEIVRTLELEGDQRTLYETLRLAQHERVRQVVKERGLSQAGIIVLDALLKLRQACCDPRLVKLPSARKVKASAKLDALFELLDGLLDDGRCILLFSQFTEMLALIEAALIKRGIAHQILTGQTPSHERTALVKRFQHGDVPLFLISLKAGGVGLNLTAADTVIHYDPWWNPAVEAQATDRAHRIGQDKPVFVYKLIASGTVEEKIQAMQGRKAELARAVLEGGGASTRLRFDEGDLDELFAPL